MKAIYVTALTLALTGSAQAQGAAPLMPGKPAGVRQAQREDGASMFVVAGAALVGITVALATVGNGPQPTNTSTATTGTSP